MDITGIEEQIGVKTRKVVEQEVKDCLRSMYGFCEKNNILRSKAPFQNRAVGGQFKPVGDLAALYWNLVTCLTEAALPVRTQLAVNEVVEKLTS